MIFPSVFAFGMEEVAGVHSHNMLLKSIFFKVDSFSSSYLLLHLPLLVAFFKE